MPFINDLQDVQARIRTDITQSQLIMNEVLDRCHLTGAAPDVQYSHLYDILHERNNVHNDILAAGLSVDVSVTGQVTELICQIALEAAATGRYDKLPRTWKWVGDFAVMGSPFNLFISVKSYKAKERLLVSGMGQNAAPVVGYGLFDDPKEWSPDRVKQYKQRGFIAVYMPRDLYDEIASKNATNPALTPRQRSRYTPANGYPATDILNIYDKPLLRKIEDFADDISRVCNPHDYGLDLSIF